MHKIIEFYAIQSKFPYLNTVKTRLNKLISHGDIMGVMGLWDLLYI